ncbi:MAG: hypothetical protein L7S63_10240, partial [Flavobacteriales bacterium]|nr:hypothetical protein [Flavobacteriales bacterium]
KMGVQPPPFSLICNSTEQEAEPFARSTTSKTAWKVTVPEPEIEMGSMVQYLLLLFESPDLSSPSETIQEPDQEIPSADEPDVALVASLTVSEKTVVCA